MQLLLPLSLPLCSFCSCLAVAAAHIEAGVAHLPCTCALQTQLQQLANFGQSVREVRSPASLLHMLLSAVSAGAAVRWPRTGRAPAAAHAVQGPCILGVLPRRRAAPGRRWRVRVGAGRCPAQALARHAPVTSSFKTRGFAWSHQSCWSRCYADHTIVPSAWANSMLAHDFLCPTMRLPVQLAVVLSDAQTCRTQVVMTTCAKSGTCEVKQRHSAWIMVPQ